MPEITYEIKEFLTMLPSLKVYSFSNEAIPIDKDLITLNMPNSLRELYVENDTNCLIDGNDWITEATKKIDQACTKGVLTKNTAARKKSRLMKKLNEK